MNFQDEKLFVTGGSGQIGRAIVAELVERGATNLTVGTRDPERLEELKSGNVRVVKLDFDKPETIDKALDGVNRLLLISTDAFSDTSRRVTQHRAAIDGAVRCGVKHIVYTSVVNPRPTREPSTPDDHFWTEEAIFESGLGWTMFRNNFYTEFAVMFAERAMKSGLLYSATGNGGRSYVTRSDVARVAAAGLLTSTGKTIHDVTGPAVITHDDIASAVTKLTGRLMKHVRVTAKQVEKQYLDTGTQGFIAATRGITDELAAEGYHAMVTSTVETFTGRPPISFFDFLEAQKPSLMNGR